MASHTFCRAKVMGQQPCSTAQAFAIVEAFLSSGSLSLADDLRANLYNLATQLEILKPLSSKGGVDGAADRQEPAATTPVLLLSARSDAQPRKKRRKLDGKLEHVKEGTQLRTVDKPHKTEESVKEHRKTERCDKNPEKSKEGRAKKRDREEKEDKKVKDKKKDKDGKKDKEPKKDKKVRGDKEGKEGSRKRPAEHPEDGGKDSVRKPKRQKVAP